MITIKKVKREIENALYTNGLYAQENVDIDGEKVTDFYVILDRLAAGCGCPEEVIYSEPYTIEEALTEFNKIEEYLASKANAYDNLIDNLK